MIRPLTYCFKYSTRTPVKPPPKFSNPPHVKFLTPNFSKPNLTFIISKNLHFSAPNHAKLFVNHENMYAHSILPPITKFEPSWKPPHSIKTVSELNEFLDKNWRLSHVTEIVEAFEKIKETVVANNIRLSDKRFDKLVDGLMDQCEKLTDEELLRLLYTLTEYPPCETSDSHNFHDVWSCLDDICCWKMGSWNLQKMYTFADVWYQLHLGRLSDYMFEMLNNWTNKPKRLPKNMLVYTFFFLNVHRRKSLTFEIEAAVLDKLEDLTIDELGVIAMGYFKTNTKIKSPRIVSAMIKAISDNVETINEITLSALLKAIRLSQRQEVANELPPMLDRVTAHLSRFSNLALVHIALTGTTLQIKHEESLQKCADRLLQDLENIRLKDIERILGACAMFNIDTKPSIFEKSLIEIQNESRRKEFVQYNRCLPCILNYLSLRKLYCYPLMDEILNEEYINENFGKSPRVLPRELFSLDRCIEVECPEYKGNRLLPYKKYKAAKWLTEFTPRPNQYWKLTLADKLYLSVTEAVVSLVGSERLVHHSHVLPHFSKSDIILCKDKKSGEFVEPIGFENYVLGDVMRASEVEKYKWFAIVVMTPNSTIRGAFSPLGFMVMKERQMKAIGYNPIFVYPGMFADQTTSEKIKWLERQLY